MQKRESELSAVRVERDSLGEIAVPAHLPFGARTARNRRHLSYSGRRLGEERAYLTALLQVKKAAARANRVAGRIPERIEPILVDTCDELITGAPPAWFPVDLLAGGGSLGVNSNVNEVIANLASATLGSPWGSYEPVSAILVNSSQSTADVCHTATRLALRRQHQDLRPVLLAAVEALDGRAERYRGVRTLARTCLRDALPAPWDELFHAYAAGLRRRTAELDEQIERLTAVSLGGTVIGSGEGAPARYRDSVLEFLREETGVPVRRRESLYDAAQNSDDLGALSASLGLLAQTVLKLCRDLRLLASGPDAGLGELVLPAVLEGSSFFPGKVNPVVPETVMSAAFSVLGNDRIVQAALEHAELQLNVFESAMAAALFDSLRILPAALRILVDDCLVGVEISRERMDFYEQLFREAARSEHGTPCT